MSDNKILYCLIAFILGWLASRMMGNGFRVGVSSKYLNELEEVVEGVVKMQNRVVDKYALGGSGIQDGEVVPNEVEFTQMRI